MAVARSERSPAPEKTQAHVAEKAGAGVQVLSGLRRREHFPPKRSAALLFGALRLLPRHGALPGESGATPKLRRATERVVGGKVHIAARFCSSAEAPQTAIAAGRRRPNQPAVSCGGVGGKFRRNAPKWPREGRGARLCSPRLSVSGRTDQKTGITVRDDLQGLPPILRVSRCKDVYFQVVMAGNIL